MENVDVEHLISGLISEHSMVVSQNKGRSYISYGMMMVTVSALRRQRMKK